ncbi:MAG: NAD(P)-dependent oxidoreductase [Opitutaceae bacterium]|nr:NAD(P)-dependent oxidoreductase [Opitutaceae bacterium]
MRIAITGATGFIGSNVAFRLARAGHQIVATGRDHHKVPALAAVPGLTLARGDLRDPSSWDAVLPGCDALVHIALGWGDEPVDMLHADTEASLRLFDAARRAGVRTIIYTSSTAACGEMAALNREDMVPRPTDFYGATKAATEAYLRGFGHKYGLNVHIIRPGYIFGEPVVEGGRVQADTRFRTICQAVRTGLPVNLVKYDGTQFLHAQDIAEVYLRLLDHKPSPTLHYALARDWVGWDEIARMAMQETGQQVDLVIEDRDYGAEPFLFDVSSIERDFGLSFANRDRLRGHVRWELARPA